MKWSSRAFSRGTGSTDAGERAAGGGRERCGGGGADARSARLGGISRAGAPDAGGDAGVYANDPGAAGVAGDTGRGAREISRRDSGGELRAGGGAGRVHV